MKHVSRGCFLLAGGLALFAGCGAESAPEKSSGTFGAVCLPSGGCDLGLRCVGGLCVRTGEPDAGALSDGRYQTLRTMLTSGRVGVAFPSLQSHLLYGGPAVNFPPAAPISDGHSCGRSLGELRPRFVIRTPAEAFGPGRCRRFYSLRSRTDHGCFAYGFALGAA